MNETFKYVRLAVLAATVLAFSAACGDTWSGAKEDTKENVKSTGQGLEKAGENIQKQTQ